MGNVPTASETRKPLRLKWDRIGWGTFIHAGVVLAPFTFTWSGLAVCGILYLLGGLGVTMGYHRLLTHHSFRTPKFVEYFLTVLGSLASQGGPLQWAATRRVHHRYSDKKRRPAQPQRRRLVGAYVLVDAF
jgi:stearoyl-CoA desaturase (delta-9 desaturase)